MRTNLPLPDTPMRFWAALWLLILGTLPHSPVVTGSGAGVVVFFVSVFAVVLASARGFGAAVGALVAAGGFRSVVVSRAPVAAGRASPVVGGVSAVVGGASVAAARRVAV